MTRVDRIIVAVFLTFQTIWVLLRLTGPFADEGIYIAAGTAIARDATFDFSWLGGSPYLFPVLSAHAFQLFGLVGSRLLAVASCTLGLVYFRRFAANLVGPAAGTWALVTLALNGMFFSFAHLAVYDCFAFAGLCVAAGLGSSSSWSVRTSVLMALFATGSLLSKYTSIVPLTALCGVLITHHRPQTRKMVLMSVAFCVGLSGLTFRLTSNSWFPQDAIASFAEQEYYSRTSVLGDWFYFVGVPTVLASYGLFLNRQNPWRVRAALLGAACAWPALHWFVGSRVSLSKHVVYSLVFLYPFVGLVARRAWGHSKNWIGALLLFLAALGCTQSHIQDRLWIEARPAALFLQSQLRHGETVGFEWGWALAPYLYETRTVEDLGAIFDLTVLKRFGKRKLCELDYIVTYEGGGTNSDYLLRAARRCGFTMVFNYRTKFWALNRVVPFPYEGRIIVYRSRPADGEHDDER